MERTGFGVANLPSSRILHSRRSFFESSSRPRSMAWLFFFWPSSSPPLELMQLPMMTVPSAWTGLGRMSQARSRYQDRQSRCWYSSACKEGAGVWLQTTKQDNGEVGGRRAVAGRWRRARFDAGSESDAKHNKAKEVLKLRLQMRETWSCRDGAARDECRRAMGRQLGWWWLMMLLMISRRLRERERELSRWREWMGGLPWTTLAAPHTW